MKKTILGILILLILFTFYLVFTNREKGPKKLIFKSSFGKQGTGLGEFGFERLISLAVKDDHLFVADSGNNRIQILKINSNGSLTAESTFGKEGKGLGELIYPSSLAIKNDHLFVADSGNNRIQILKINSNGSLTAESTFGEEDVKSRDFSFKTLISLAIKDNYLFAADSGNNRIQILKINSNGSLTAESTFGKEGKGLGEFKGVFGFSLAIKNNHLFIVESANNRIQILKINSDKSLSYQSNFYFSGENYSFIRFFTIGLDITENFLFLADSEKNCIKIFKINPDYSLTLYSAFGKEGMGLGQFNAPLGLTIKGNYLYVVDSGNQRIQILEIKY